MCALEGEIRMKIIAMYLPQFHEIPENDIWWGKGYTEWTAVKGGKPLFQGHDQPKKPLAENYYDLLNEETLKSQADLAREYGIYGFCFYHYWFEEGKKILEKPAENLLRRQDIDMPFCFCWANQTWARTWSKIQGANAWTSLYEKNEKGKEILLKQKYGREKEWQDHFNYLVQFFSDYRYIKIDNKPVMVIYKPDDIYCLRQMIEYWNERAIESGFDGIYIIGENCNKNSYMNSTMEHQPATVWAQMAEQVDRSFGVATLDYEQMWINIINSVPETEDDVFYMGFTGFDNTPRYGNEGLVVKGISPLIFEKYFAMLVKKSRHKGNEYIFLNAWNEWGEGMYLEPDEQNGYAFLESCKRAISDKQSEEIVKSSTVIKEACSLPESKIRRYYKLLNKWMELRGNGKHLADYLVDNQYFSIAIYGFGDFGKHFLQEVKDFPIEVKYVIDNRYVESSIKVLSNKDEWPTVDAIIVTPFLEFENILEFIEKKVKCAVLSIEEIIFEID